MIDNSIIILFYKTKKEQFNCSFLVDCFIITLKYIVFLNICIVELHIFKINDFFN